MGCKAGKEDGRDIDIEDKFDNGGETRSEDSNVTATIPMRISMGSLQPSMPAVQARVFKL